MAWKQQKEKLNWNSFSTPLSLRQTTTIQHSRSQTCYFTLFYVLTFGFRSFNMENVSSLALSSYISFYILGSCKQFVRFHYASLFLRAKRKNVKRNIFFLPALRDGGTEHACMHRMLRFMENCSFITAANIKTYPRQFSLFFEKKKVVRIVVQTFAQFSNLLFFLGNVCLRFYTAGWKLEASIVFVSLFSRLEM